MSPSTARRKFNRIVCRQDTPSQFLRGRGGGNLTIQAYKEATKFARIALEKK